MGRLVEELLFIGIVENTYMVWFACWGTHTFGGGYCYVHLLGHELEPKAQHVRAGSADLCFIIGAVVEQAIQELVAKGIEVIDGPVIRPSNGSDCISLLSQSGR